MPIESGGTDAVAPAGELPNRYGVRERDGLEVLVCREAPGLAVRLDRRFAFTEAEARKLPERSILLDGAGAFGPLVDDAGHLYNLDHHDGCLRAFTLATCEQALILVNKGLELDKGDWTVYANEPDLDTVFALWVLLNHRRVRSLDTETRDRIVPLLRLEGAIDANGFELAELCGLPQETLGVEKARLDELHRLELEAKRSGQWGQADLYGYTHDMLLEIDRRVFRGTDFSDYASVEEEYGHVEIGQGRVAVVCRDSSGIYEVEKRLKTVWGDRLGIVALEKDPHHYTLRRAAALSGIDLGEAYEKLNLLDPAVDGRPPKKRWGGSDDIGGSPRPDGTGLTPREIGKILKLTYKRVRPAQRLQRMATAVLWVLVLVLAAGVGVVAWRFFGPQLLPDSILASNPSFDLSLAAAISGLGAWLLTRQLSRGWIWLYGWRRSAGRDWWPLVPLVVLGAAFGVAWVPSGIGTTPADRALAALAVVLAAAALELMLRGLVHGLLILDHRVQGIGGSWFLSLPTLVTATIFAGATALAAQFWTAPPPLALPPELAPWSWAILAGAAFVVGLALGAIRERSLSLWPAVLATAAGGLGRLAVEWWLL